MASTYKTFTSNDIATSKTLLHEAIPITGTIVSGTYSDLNIKSFAHGMFQSVYDYPYLSSSANHIFDITVGYANSSAFSASTSTQNSKKINIYAQMAQVLAGFDATGSVQLFDKDGDFSGGAKHTELIFLSFSRLLVKDEIQKGTVSLQFLTGGSYTAFNSNQFLMTLTDIGATGSYKVNSPVGDYGILYSGSVATSSAAYGLVFYQAGVVALNSSIFGWNFHSSSIAGVMHVTGAIATSSIGDFASAVRRRMYNISFNNTTELNSTIYFCRGLNNEFNYSSNPTYLTGSKVRVKNNNSLEPPVAYITTVGLYGPDNALLGVAKLSEPIKKTPSEEVVIKIRADF